MSSAFPKGVVSPRPPIDVSLISQHPDFTSLRDLPGLQLDLRYQSTNNFLGRNLYGDLDLAYLHRLAAEPLLRAFANLQTEQPQLKMLLLDGLRPQRVQKVLWAAVVGTAEEKYIADPAKGSIHSFGFAIDLTLVDERGVELDMGTPFDSFEALAEPHLESENLRAGLLTKKQFQNRLLLRVAMISAGFIQNPEEWWHFDALPQGEVRSRFSLVE